MSILNNIDLDSVTQAASVRSKYRIVPEGHFYIVQKYKRSLGIGPYKWVTLKDIYEIPVGVDQTYNCCSFSLIYQLTKQDMWFETFEAAQMTVNKLISNDLFKIESKNK